MAFNKLNTKHQVQFETYRYWCFDPSGRRRGSNTCQGSGFLRTPDLFPCMYDIAHRMFVSPADTPTKNELRVTPGPSAPMAKGAY